MKTSYLCTCLMVAAGLGLTACANNTAAMTTGLVSQSTSSQLSDMRDSISISDVQGGKDSILVVTVSNEEIETALRQSLRNNGLLANGRGNYLLVAELVNVKFPFAAFDVKTTIDMRYILSDAVTGDVLLDELIETRHKTQFSESLIGEKRARKAMAGAIRKNISSFLEKLGEQVGGMLNETDEPDGTITISFRLEAEPTSL